MRLLAVAMIGCLLTSCGGTDDVSTTAITNQQPEFVTSVAPVNGATNVVTDRQHLVVSFQTTEVVSVPYQEKGFIVRDTNGSIWYVNVSQGDVAGLAGMTQLMDPFSSPTNRQPLTYSSTPVPPMPAKMQAHLQAFVKRIIQDYLATNRPTVLLEDK